jgi:hypothetical protein
MLRIIIRMEKMAALHRSLVKNGLLKGTTSSSYDASAASHSADIQEDDGGISDSESAGPDADDENDINAECLLVPGEPVNASLTEVKLAVTVREYSSY